jgi:predicted ribosomally synthesized peptide with nif11-like leader
LEGKAMSKKAVETFLKTLDENEAFGKEFAGEMPKTVDPARVVAFASTHGFDFTEDELEKHAASFAVKPPPGVLSDSELDGVVGGISFSSTTPYGAASTQLLRGVYYAAVDLNKFM